QDSGCRSTNVLVITHMLTRYDEGCLPRDVRGGGACYDLVTMSTKYLVLSIGLMLAALVSACGGDGKTFPVKVSVGPNAIGVIPVNSEYVVGPNRFAFGLLSPETGAPIVDAKVHLRFYDLNDGEEFKFETDAISRVP